jgi:dTDP-4-amino-4,6-dideoxygalactose transaminase
MSNLLSDLAINGGTPVRTAPMPTGKRFGDEEKKLLNEAIDSDMLFYVSGTKVKAMQEKFREMYGMKYCAGCSSGTAAVHIALGALSISPGSEVITSAVTDMGTLTGVLYQCLIPRFADIDPVTYNMSPQGTEQLINDKTKAIIVVHHAGVAADMDAFLALSQKYNIPLIEDCAQAYLTHYKGRLCGTMGDISTYSLNHFKHITCGSGGMVMTNRDDIEERVRLFIDKCYFRDGRERNPYFLAPNYQMTELQGAVAIAQLDKVEDIVKKRVRLAKQLGDGLTKIDGVVPHGVLEGCDHTGFLYTVRLQEEKFNTDVDGFCAALTAEGIPNQPHMVTGGRPIYNYDIFRNRSAFPHSQFPFVSKDLDSNIEYSAGDCPEAEKAFTETFNIRIDEFQDEGVIVDMLSAIAKVADAYRK